MRKECYGKFQEELARDPAYAFICYIDANYVASSAIQGIARDTVMGHHGVGVFWNVHGGRFPIKTVRGLETAPRGSQTRFYHVGTLEVKNLSVSFFTPRGEVQAVRDVSFP